MIDPNVVHRRSFTWLWWLLGLLLAIALLWILATQVGDEVTDLQTNPDSTQAPPSAGPAEPTS